MTTRSALVVVSVFGLVVVAFLVTSFAADDAPSNWNSVQAAYARANLELAKARLAVAENENQTVAESVPMETIASLQSGVQLAEAWLHQLESGNTGDPYAAQIAAAEAAITGLETNHNESIKANQIQAGSVPPLELGKEEAEIKMAKARLAALKSLAQQPFEVRVQWEMRQIQDEIRALWARPLLED